jgi:glyceraldehyde 3-phosphate dehydrogenase
MARIALHGFGRIGRSTLRAALRAGLWTPVSISDIRDIPTFAALFEVDTNYGRWHEPVSAMETGFDIGGREIPYLNSMDALPDWGAMGVDLVVDCTGRATTRAVAQAHLDRGAGHVLVSAPSKTQQDCDAVLLPGINLEHYNPATDRIVSMASCNQRPGAGGQGAHRALGIRSGLFSRCTPTPTPSRSRSTDARST